MARNLFELLNQVFKLMAENKLKRDIDDTLLEKLLTLIQKCTFHFSEFREIIDNMNNENSSSDFIKDLIQRTEALYLIEKVLSSVTSKNENISVGIKSFVLRFLGVILEQHGEVIIPYEKLLPLFKDSNSIVTDHAFSIQDALLYCLSCIVKKIEGVMWFINQNLQDFVISNFNSSSYYVRKSAVNFFVDFLSRWSAHLVNNKERKSEDAHLETFIQNLISSVLYKVCLYQNSKEIASAECYIIILKNVMESKTIEVIRSNHLSFAENISDCFMNLSEDKKFNGKLADLFLTIHSKFSLPSEMMDDVIKCLIFKEDIELAFDVTSSYACTAWAKYNYPEEVKIFFLPAYILLNMSPNTLFECSSIFSINYEDVYAIISKKMDDKSQCKLLFKSSLAALQKVAPQMNTNLQKCLALTMLKISKCSEDPYHKWLYSVLEDRLVHQSLIEFYSSLLSDEVYSSLKYETSDLVFQTILEYLKKKTSDSNFISQLLSLMTDILKLHKAHEFDVEKAEKADLSQMLCRVLLDNRESVVDSAIHLARQVISMRTWQSEVIQYGIHLIVWDIAIEGNLDGTTRSTALKVIIESCLEPWCLKEILLNKAIAESDIPADLYDLIHDPDFFLQREALSCLFLWSKSKWHEIPSLCIKYLHDASVSAIKSLDLEMKLVSLDVWNWLLTEKYKYSNASTSFLTVEDYITHLTTCGFGLSMIIALEDYDPAVQHKAASILNELKKTLISNGISFDTLQLQPLTTADESIKCTSAESLLSPISREEKEKGIDVVMELSTSEQITNICRPLLVDDFKHNQHTDETKETMCEISSFWTTLWSENVISILQPVKATENVIEYESLLKDIILARVMEYDSVDDIPDCY